MNSSPRVPNPGVCYLHPSELAALGLVEEYERAAARRKAEGARREKEGPDNAPRKDVRRDPKRIA